MRELKPERCTQARRIQRKAARTQSRKEAQRGEPQPKTGRTGSGIFGRNGKETNPGIIPLLNIPFADSCSIWENHCQGNHCQGNEGKSLSFPHSPDIHSPDQIFSKMNDFFLLHCRAADAKEEVQPRISRITRIRIDWFLIRAIRVIRGEKSSRQIRFASLRPRAFALNSHCMLDPLNGQ